MEGKQPYMQPPQYGGQSQPQPQVIYTTQTPLVLGPIPQRVICPSCHAEITTTVKQENSTKTHLFAALLCLICFPLVCVPYCVDSCHAQTHYCPACHSYIGRFEK